MTDYTKLVEQLRWNATEYEGCIFGEEDKQMCADAADAIEELQKDKAIANRKLDSVLKKVPKCGEWKCSYPEIEPNPMFMYGICSICGFEQSISNKLNYCPNCGAKMEVQDESISKFADGEWWKEARE